jgi:hypothetical protein
MNNSMMIVGVDAPTTHDTKSKRSEELLEMKEVFSMELKS